MNKLFRELILVALRKQDALSYIPSEHEWSEAYTEAEKQSLIGICFSGIERLPKHQLPNMELLMDWLGQAEYIKSQNESVSNRCGDITRVFAEGGIRSVVLKGQGTALLYHKPDLRTSGDIDLWVEGKRDDVIAFLKCKGYKMGSVFIHHIDVDIFDDVPVEVHTNPSYTYDPFRWRKYKKWFADQGRIQFQLLDKSLGYAYPSVGFNTVYSLLHIFRHVFHEGIGLRQLLDYYFILQHTDESIRHEAMKTLRWMGLVRFVAAIMYVEQEVFALEYNKLLCKPAPKAGQFLLDEIIVGGNFGHYDDRIKKAHSGNLAKLYFHNTGRLINMLKYFPSEVLWSPLWKPAHYVWRKWNRY